MKAGDLSELHLAAIISIATLLGGLGSSLLSALWIDAGTQRETDVQMVQLAIGILSQPLPEHKGSGNLRSINVSRTGQMVLREWAVDIINAASDVKFDRTARDLLIDGELKLPFSYYIDLARKYERFKEFEDKLPKEQSAEPRE
ncbi:hypothetical protein [Paracoccus yeei]|uniref:hypothetical protein n=1 Tax=Paracoccus yeei TaxID=147645 RepID=UPI0035B0AE9A